MAAIVLRDDAKLSAEQFAQFLAQQRDLSPKAWPRYVWIAADLPSTATNKILKRELIGLGTALDGRLMWKRDGFAFHVHEQRTVTSTDR
jgi:fatty-acyl-CoA synthase